MMGVIYEIPYQTSQNVFYPTPTRGDFRSILSHPHSLLAPFVGTIDWKKYVGLENFCYNILLVSPTKRYVLHLICIPSRFLHVLRKLPTSFATAKQTRQRGQQGQTKPSITNARWCSPATCKRGLKYKCYYGCDLSTRDKHGKLDLLQDAGDPSRSYRERRGCWTLSIVVALVTTYSTSKSSSVSESSPPDAPPDIMNSCITSSTIGLQCHGVTGFRDSIETSQYAKLDVQP